MDEHKQAFNQVTSTSRFFKNLALSLVLIGLFFTVYVIVLSVSDQEIAPIFFTLLFFSFFFSFISLFIFLIVYARAYKKITEVVIRDYWRVWIKEVIRFYDDYMIEPVSSKDERLIKHAFIPSQANETLLYELSLESINRRLTASSYTFQRHTGQQTSQTTYFRGYAIMTDLKTEEGLFVQREKTGLLGKIAYAVNTYKPSEIKDGFAYDGTLEQGHIDLILKIEKLGYKDVILLEQEGTLMILVWAFDYFPRVSSSLDKMKIKHITHLRKLVDLLQVTA